MESLIKEETSSDYSHLQHPFPVPPIALKFFLKCLFLFVCLFQHAILFLLDIKCLIKTQFCYIFNRISDPGPNLQILYPVLLGKYYVQIEVLNYIAIQPTRNTNHHELGSHSTSTQAPDSLFHVLKIWKFTVEITCSQRAKKIKWRLKFDQYVFPVITSLVRTRTKWARRKIHDAKCAKEKE